VPPAHHHTTCNHKMPPNRKSAAPTARAPKRTRARADESEEDICGAIPVARLLRVTGKDIYDLPDEDEDEDEDENELATVVKIPVARRRRKVVTYASKARLRTEEVDPLADELASMASPMVGREVKKATGAKATTKAADAKAPSAKVRAAKVMGKEKEGKKAEADEEQKGEATTNTPMASKSKAAPAKVASTKTPNARARAKSIQVAEEEDEGEEKENEGVTTKTAARSSKAANIKAALAKTPKTKPRMNKVMVVEEEDKAEVEEEDEEEEAVTPKTVVKNAKPPRTQRKKCTSSAPRTRIQGKMGVGVPAGGDELTPSAKRSVVPPPVEGVIMANGMIAPASVARPGTGKKKRPSGARPSLGTEGLEDPFAVPKGVAVVAWEDDSEEAEEEARVASPPTVASATKTRSAKKTPTQASKASLKTTPDEPKLLGEDIEVSADAVSMVRTHVHEKIMGRKRLHLVGIDEEYKNVHHLLEQTVTAGEGNSMLIIGSRGSGKTTLVETALSSLMSTHSGEFYIVRLNGLLQTDDKLALREIWRQLGVEMELEGDDQPKSTNFADTLQSILAILSHPDELQAQNEEGAYVAEDPARTAVAVIFVLDEFDHFVTHPRQTLLYNLFDIAQAKKAPIAVLGLTCKVDVIDSLEKRVKSRFSHRTIHLKLPASLDAFWDVVKEGLVIDVEAATLYGRETERYAEAWNHYIDVSMPRPLLHITI